MLLQVLISVLKGVAYEGYSGPTVVAFFAFPIVAYGTLKPKHAKERSTQ
jgi:hypothetical protein